MFFLDTLPAPSNHILGKAANDANHKAATRPGPFSTRHTVVPKKISGATRQQVGSAELFKSLYSHQPVSTVQDSILKRKAETQIETPAKKLRAIGNNLDTMVAKNATLKLDHELTQIELVALRDQVKQLELDQQKNELQSREHKAKIASLQAENKALKEKVRKVRQVWNGFHGLGNILGDNDK